MKKNEQGVSLIDLLIILFVAGIVVFVGWYVWHKHSGSSQRQAPTESAILFELKDSGSTNTEGWNLTVANDGSGKLAYEHRHSAIAPDSKTFPQGSFDVKSLAQSLGTTSLSGSPSECIRSVSFGEVVTLIYHNQTIEGFDCYISGNPKSPLADQFGQVIDKVRKAYDGTTTFTGTVTEDECVNRKAITGSDGITAAPPPIGDVGCTITVDTAVVTIVHGNTQEPTWGNLDRFTYDKDITGKRVAVHAHRPANINRYAIDGADDYVKLLN